MQSVINSENAVHYVSQSDMMIFVLLNSDFEDNDDFVDKCDNSIFKSERAWYNGKISKNEAYDDFAVEWVNKFFDAHPFIKKVCFVFDD